MRIGKRLSAWVATRLRLLPLVIGVAALMFVLTRISQVNFGVGSFER